MHEKNKLVEVLQVKIAKSTLICLLDDALGKPFALELSARESWCHGSIIFLLITKRGIKLEISGMAGANNWLNCQSKEVAN